MEQLKAQTDEIWKAKKDIADILEEKKKKEKAKKTAQKQWVEDLIKDNGGKTYKKGTLEDFILQLADLIVFGGLKPCPKCSRGLYYSSSLHGYKCGGDDKSETKCDYFSADPERKPFAANKEFKKYMEKYDQKTLLPKRVYSTAVEEGMAEHYVRSANTLKRDDPAHKRKKEKEPVMRENGFAVDPFFKLPEDYHVFVGENEDPWQCLLQKPSDSPDYTLKYWKMQLLESDDTGIQDR
jgi:hypothetical protein